MPKPKLGLVIASEWKNSLDRKDFDKRSTKPDPITIFGNPTPATGFQAGLDAEQMKLTRHHVIPHSLLINAWEIAVDCDDMELIKALTVWAGKDPARDLPATFAKGNPSPQAVLRKVAWNPFNIVSGPLSEHRVEDPGNEFDSLEFRTLVPHGAAAPTTPAEKLKLQTENVARQEFNRHIGVLRRIYNLLQRYISDQVAAQDVTSLISLLRSDVPERYPALGPKYRTGALLSPDLWGDYSTIQATAPASQYDFASKRAVAFSKGKPKIVPWSAATWLPEVNLVLPKAAALDMTDNTVWTDEKTVPGTPSSSTLPLGGMDEATFRIAVVRAIRKAGKFEAQVALSGPSGTLSNMAQWTAFEVKQLNREGYKIKISRTMLDSPAQEVRVYNIPKPGAAPA